MGAWSIRSAAPPSADVPVASTPIRLLRTTVPPAAAPKTVRPPPITFPSAAVAPPIVLPPPPCTVTDPNAGGVTVVVPAASVPTKFALSVFPAAVTHTFRLVNPRDDESLDHGSGAADHEPVVGGASARAVHHDAPGRVAGLARAVDRHLRRERRQRQVQGDRRRAKRKVEEDDVRVRRCVGGKDRVAKLAGAYTWLADAVAVVAVRVDGEDGPERRRRQEHGRGTPRRRARPSSPDGPASPGPDSDTPSLTYAIVRRRTGNAIGQRIRSDGTRHSDTWSPVPETASRPSALAPYLPAARARLERGAGRARAPACSTARSSRSTSPASPRSPSGCSRRARAGAEELVRRISGVFDGLIAVAERHGGDVLKFRGDALLLLFVGERHAERACGAASDMQWTIE